jgi:hypothetical protein
MGRLDVHMASRRLASVLPWRCFRGVRRQLQHPPSAAILPVYMYTLLPFPKHVSIREYLALKSNIGLSQRKIVALVVHIP